MAVLKVKEVRKKNTMVYSIGKVFPRVLKIRRLREPSLFCLEITLPGQNRIPHRNIDINPLSQGHHVKEVQSLFLISPWLEPILLELHMYILVGLEPTKTPGYLVT